MQPFQTFPKALVCSWHEKSLGDSICSVWSLLIIYSAVQGHAGKFVFGQIGPQKTPVALLVGRAQSVLGGCRL